MNQRMIGIVIVVALAAAMVFAGIVSALPDGATVLTNVSASTKGAVTAESDTAQGGYITGLNLTVEQSTAKWQGYFGNITGSIVLEDSSGNEMFNWGDAVAGGGEVFATTSDSAPTWSAVNSVTNAELIHGTNGINALWSWETTQTDDADATFSTTDTVTVAGTEITGTVATAANAILPSGQSWQTLVITDTADISAKTDYIFIGIINDNHEAFDTTSKDYQMIVPTADTPAASDTYYFYVELT